MNWHLKTAMALMCTFLLVGCAPRAPKESTHSIHYSKKTERKITNSSQDNKSTTKTKQSRASSPETDTAVGPAESESIAPLWSLEKRQQLAAFMRQWQAEMHQTWVNNRIGTAEYDNYPFKDYYNRQQVGLSLILPNPSIAWSDTGIGTADYQLVDAYGAISPTGNMQYLFTLRDGEPLVFYSAQNQGNQSDPRYIFMRTQNRALVMGFANIVQGRTPNADNPQSVAYLGKDYWTLDSAVAYLKRVYFPKSDDAGWAGYRWNLISNHANQIVVNLQFTSSGNAIYGLEYNFDGTTTVREYWGQSLANVDAATVFRDSDGYKIPGHDFSY
ncbi:DUF4767 domain-containing protein [Schleiferilactobacillus shenzhenensis]|uniref:DUF4767 domain-containing protein n=1 Tax=Schleiferilactobacillus shenzhenensis TaxID=1231337 RepID=UPI00041AD414|nr:DUF4767 domain-containing protein [Schleiferilactobacillus shenzhenensis]